MLAHIHPSPYRFTARLVIKILFPTIIRHCVLKMVSSFHRHAPRAPLPASGVTFCGVTFPVTSEGVTPPSSLLRAHAPDQNPPAVFDFITTGLCRLSPVPAGRWPFPTLSLQSLRRCLDPYPAVSFQCYCPFLPGRQRPIYTKALCCWIILHYHLFRFFIFTRPGIKRQQSKPLSRFNQRLEGCICKQF